MLSVLLENLICEVGNYDHRGSKGNGGLERLGDRSAEAKEGTETLLPKFKTTALTTGPSFLSYAFYFYCVEHRVYPVVQNRNEVNTVCFLQVIYFRVHFWKALIHH